MCPLFDHVSLSKAVVSCLASQTAFAKLVKGAQLIISGSPSAETEQLSRYVVCLQPHDDERGGKPLLTPRHSMNAFWSNWLKSILLEVIRELLKLNVESVD